MHESVNGPDDPPIWYEFNWNLEDEEGEKMQVSRLKSAEPEEEGDRTVLMTFPTKGFKLNWLMVATGCSNTTKWQVQIHNK